MRWDLIESNSGVAAGSRGAQTPKRGRRVGIYDEKLLPQEAGRPLELVMAGGKSTFETAEFNRAFYSVNRFTEGNFEVVVFESLFQQSGLRVTKTYRIPRKGFESHVVVKLTNVGTSELVFDEGGLGLGITLGPGLGYMAKRRGNDPGEEFARFTRGFYKTADALLNVDAEPGRPFLVTGAQPSPVKWSGLHTLYFLMALLPFRDGPLESRFAGLKFWIEPGVQQIKAIEEEQLPHFTRVAAFSGPLHIQPGASAELGFRVYVGPKQEHLLRGAENGLEDMVFNHVWGWVAGIALFLGWMLESLNSVVGNWGASIVILALVFRVLFLPLARYGLKQQKASLQRQALFNLELEKVKEEFKNDTRKREGESLRVYKEYGPKPIGQLKGCLPVMIQLPLFIIMFQFLTRFYEIRGSSFLWISDLSLPDRLFPLGFSLPWLGGFFNLLPFIMLVVQLASAKLTQEMAKSNVTRKKGKTPYSLYVSPVALFFLFYPFPSGPLLYFTIGSISQVVEQKVIATRYLSKEV